MTRPCWRLQLAPSFLCGIAFAFPPQHHGIDESFRLRTGDVAEGHYELVKSRIYARATYSVDIRLGFEGDGDAFAELLLGLGYELFVMLAVALLEIYRFTHRCEQNMQGVFSHRLLFVSILLRVGMLL